MSMVLGKLKERGDIKVLKESVFPAEQLKDKPFWSTFAEVEIEVDGIETLVGFCFDFLPSSIEIIKPNKFMIEDASINNMLNDLIAKLHQYDMVLKNVHAQNILLKKKIENQ